MKVTLRTKPIQDGKLRIYLDYYPPITHPKTGKLTRREFLSLYVFSEIELKEEKYVNDSEKELIRIIPMLDNKKQPKKVRLTPLQRQHNKETYELAENIKAQRQLQIQSEDYGFLTQDRNADFLPFLKDLADQRKEKGDNNYMAVYNYFFKFSNGNCPVSRLTTSFCNEFKEFLKNVEAFTSGKKTKLTNNSIIIYYGIFTTALRKAESEKLIDESPTKGLGRIKKIESKQREFLTGDELQAVASSTCDLPILKNAALFSALTGLRFSDIEKLTWGEIVNDKNGVYSIRFITKKTKRAETLPISAQAVTFLGERKGAGERVFTDLKYGSWQNTVITRWVHKAGVNKHITFHCFRHTFATLQITLGTDIYTVSKMLGHQDIGTTQIYAKIIDEKKRAAADKIMILL